MKDLTCFFLQIIDHQNKLDFYLLSDSASSVSRCKPFKTTKSHPPTSNKVNNTIKALKEQGGSSFQAIKKYITSNYKIDAKNLSPFIQKYLKTAVTGAKLIQTQGKGASGSFKLPDSPKGKSELAPKKSLAKKGRAASI